MSGAVFVLATLIWLVSGVILDAGSFQKVSVEGDSVGVVNVAPSSLSKVNAVSGRFALAGFGAVLVSTAAMRAG